MKKSYSLAGDSPKDASLNLVKRCCQTIGNLIHRYRKELTLEEITKFEVQLMSIENSLKKREKSDAQ